MKQTLISILRNRETSLESFRQAADQLATILAVEAASRLPTKRQTIDTPIARTEVELILHDLVLVPVLRSGLVLLPHFLRFYPQARVGFIGAKRDEETAESSTYYLRLPKITEKCPVFILEPMIATGGSACMVMEHILKAGAKESNITLISFIGAPQGIKKLKDRYPQAEILIAQIDEGLNDKNWIIPGLGDFGDRYYAE